MFRIMASRAAAVLLFCLSMAVWAATPFGTDLSGRPIEQIAPAGSRAVVLFFAASDCPISNRYIPEIERLDREFAPQGVRFWWVYPNPGDTAAVVSQHNEQFDIHGNVALDTAQRLTQMAHATMTPEVAVFVPFLGRIARSLPGTHRRPVHRAGPGTSQGQRGSISRRLSARCF